MRRLLRDIAEGRELGDVTTLRDPDVMQALEGKIKERQAEGGVAPQIGTDSRSWPSPSPSGACRARSSESAAARAVEQRDRDHHGERRRHGEHGRLDEQRVELDVARPAAPAR